MRNLQEQVKKAFCYQKLFWLFTVWINCSSDRKILLKSEAEGREFAKVLRSLEQFFLTVGQNNFGNKIPFFLIIIIQWWLYAERIHFWNLQLEIWQSHEYLSAICLFDLSFRHFGFFASQHTWPMRIHRIMLLVLLVYVFGKFELLATNLRAWNDLWLMLLK